MMAVLRSILLLGIGVENIGHKKTCDMGYHRLGIVGKLKSYCNYFNIHTQ